MASAASIVPTATPAAAAPAAGVATTAATRAPPASTEAGAPPPPDHLQTYIQTAKSSIGMSGANRPVLNLGLSFKLPVNELIDAVLR